MRDALIAVQLLNERGGIEGGAVGPVAVEAEHRDGVFGQDLAVFRVGGVDVDEALDVGADGIVLVENCLRRLGQLDGDLDIDCGVDRNLHCGDRQTLEQQICVIGGDLAVAVEVCNRQVAVVAAVVARDMLKDALCIVRVGLAVTVHVARDLAGRDKGLAANLVRDFRRQRRRPGVEIGRAFMLEHVLREHVGCEGVLLCLAGEVVDGEFRGVDARLFGVVAEFCLDLAVSSSAAEVVLHHDVGIRRDHIADIGKTGTLIQDGVRRAAVAVDDGLCGGHQKAVDELTGRLAGLLLQLVLTNVLAQHSRHTGNLRGSHRGTGHGLVGVVAGVAAFALMCAVDGVDVAAGRGDLGLELQTARDAPGAEVTHGVELGVELSGADTAHDGHLAGRVLAVRGLRGGCPDRFAVGLRDGDARSGLGVVGQVHVDGARLVVVNDGRDRALLNSIVALQVEGDAAALHEDDLVGHIDAVIVCDLACNTCGKDDIIMFTRQRGQRRVLIIGLVVEHVVFANREEAAGRAVVVDGGDSQRVGERSGRAVGLERNFVVIQIRNVVDTVGSPVGGVACGHADDHTVGGEAVHDVRELASHTAEAGGAGAEGQVDGVAAENDGILDRRHVVGVICAAARAEDLHGNDLRIGRNTLHKDRLQRVGECAVTVGNVGICRCDAFHVGAVFARTVLHVIDGVVLVNVVVCKRDLVIQIGLIRDLGIQLRKDLGGQIVLCQDADAGLVGIERHALLFRVQLHRVVVAVGGERLMLIVDAGVDHSDLAASTGITCRPSSVGTDLRRGSSHVRVCRAGRDDHGLIACLDHDALDAGDLFDLLDRIIANVCRNEVCSERQIPRNIQLCAGRGADLAGHVDLCVLQAAAIGNSRGIGRDVSRAETLDRGSLFQHDGDTNVVIRCVLVVTFCAFFVQNRFRKLRENSFVSLLKLQILLSRIRRDVHRDNKAHEERQDEEQRKDTTREMFLHVLSFLPMYFFPCRASMA